MAIFPELDSHKTLVTIPCWVFFFLVGWEEVKIQMMKLCAGMSCFPSDNRVDNDKQGSRKRLS